VIPDFETPIIKAPRAANVHNQGSVIMRPT
jgi:hypothetical protein